MGVIGGVAGCAGLGCVQDCGGATLVAEAKEWPLRNAIANKGKRYLGTHLC